MSENGWVQSQYCSPHVKFLQEINELKNTDAGSKQVKIPVLELRQQVARSKWVREKHVTVGMPDSVYHMVVVASGC